MGRAADGGVCVLDFLRHLGFAAGELGLGLLDELLLEGVETLLVAGGLHLLNLSHVLLRQTLELGLLLRIESVRLDHRHLLRRQLLARDDVELRCRRAALRVHLVARARSRQSAALVEVARIEDLGLLRIAQVAAAELCAGLRRLAVGVAGLNHEFVDDAVEERAVVRALLHQLQKVGLVTGCVAVELHRDVALRGVDEHIFVCCGCHRCCVLFYVVSCG